MVFVNGTEAVETMFRTEGKYPSRGAVFEQTVTNIYKHSNWPSGLIFASVVFHLPLFVFG